MATMTNGKAPAHRRVRRSGRQPTLREALSPATALPNPPTIACSSSSASDRSSTSAYASARHWQRMEGSWEPKRLVVLEFPSVEQARCWYDSEEYREARAIRERAAVTDLLIAEGVSG
jgi:uncharacterized protein DUF1330